MVRRAPGAGDARVYDVSGRRATPLSASLSVGARATAAQKRARRKLELQDTDTDLIQDFEFPTVCNRIKVCADGRHIFASGTYPPQLHVYDTAELSLKFKRHVSAEIVELQVLQDSWTKFALLTADRYVDLHSPFGSHFRTRVPRFGRDLMLHRGSCDLFVCGDGRDVWRLNLEQGRFLAPLHTQSGLSGGNNVCGISPVNSLLMFGGEDGIVDVWDPRAVGQGGQKPAGTLDVVEAMAGEAQSVKRLAVRAGRPEISAVRFDEANGVSFAVGTSTGFTFLFDLRSPRVALSRDQGNGLPVKCIRMHEDGRHCISADAKSVKVWDRRNGRNMVAVEPDADVNHVCMVGNSGVMCVAVEAPRVKTYYVPALGAAPSWCAFLDTFTEELEDRKRKQSDGLGARIGAFGGEEEEQVEEVYENYKFVSHDELEGLGLGHLVGTDMLKPYMHGYFVHQKLYRRAVEVSEPFAYDKYRKEKAREKVEAERQSRITKKKSTKSRVKVNQKVVEAIEEKSKKGGKKGAAGMSILQDDRFSAMFSNKDYAVDEDAERFQHLNPSGAGKSGGKQADDVDEEDDSDEEYLEQFELVDDGDVGERVQSIDGVAQDVGLSSSEESDDSESDNSGSGDRGGQVGDTRVGSGNISKQASTRAGGSRTPKSFKPPRAPRMYEIGRMAEHGAVGTNSGSAAQRRKVRDEVSLGARVNVPQRGGGGMPSRGSGRGRAWKTERGQG